MNIFKWLQRRQSVRSAVLSLFKRGLARGKKQNRQGAMDDYTAVIDRVDAPSDVRAMALYNRGLLHAGQKNLLSATDDLQAVLAMEAAPHDVKSAAGRTLDRMRRQQGNPTASPSDTATPT